MFGLIKKLREKDEQIGELQNRLDVANAKAQIEELYGKECDIKLKKATEKHKAECEEWLEKYTVLREKYLNLLERYEKVLESKPDARREIAERWLNDD